MKMTILTRFSAHLFSANKRTLPFYTCCFSSSKAANKNSKHPQERIQILGTSYECDSLTNVTPAILSKVGQNLHNKKHHPLNLIRQRIQDFFYGYAKNSRGNPLFSVYDNLSPVVTQQQNFDSLLVPHDHVSRKLTDSYYINSNFMLRAHTSAHQSDMIRSGLDGFLVIGDVYRRDAIDCTHYPVFHQVEGVRLFTESVLFPGQTNFCFFENGERTSQKQAWHTIIISQKLEENLKKCLLQLAIHLFGTDIEARWVSTTFPFTHPSWEMEIKYQGDWLEVLGCGIMEQEILHNAGAGNRVGWAFGLGLERLAMILYKIKDIRQFWSNDTGFLSQFQFNDPYTPIEFKPVSQYPQCINDISFWLPEDYEENNFYALVRDIGGNIIEQVYIIDDYFHPKKKRRSHCYRIVYRHLEKTLSQKEVNDIHLQIEAAVVKQLGGEIR